MLTYKIYENSVTIWDKTGNFVIFQTNFASVPEFIVIPHMDINSSTRTSNVVKVVFSEK